MRKISLREKRNTLSPKTKMILIICTVVILVVGGAIFTFLKNYHIYDTKVYRSTCTTKGYTESICKICGDIHRVKYTAPYGHDYGKKKLKVKPTELEFGEYARKCSRCGVEEVEKIEPAIKMKKFMFVGDAFTVDQKKVATGSMIYSYKGKKQEYFIALDYEDDSYSRYIKHDYKITFYSDKKLTKPVKLKLMDGVKASETWYFYGNFYDFKNLRDVVATDIFKEVRKTSTKIDSRIDDNYLTNQSEPVLFFMNNAFVGVFRLLETDSAEVMNVKETDKMCAMVRASYSTSQSFFKTVATDNGAWKIKYNYTDDKDWVYDSLNKLIKFVIEKDGKEFKKGISKYLDVDGMIDYMLTVYFTGAADNVARCLTLSTYDGKVWTPSLFDVNASFGINNDGDISTLETVLAPSFDEDDKSIIDSDTNSLLWEKMMNNFYDEIKAKYMKLENTVFTSKNIYSKFKSHEKKVPQIVYDKEKTKYEQVDTTTDLKQSLVDFVATRKNTLGVFFKNEQAKPKKTTKSN